MSEVCGLLENKESIEDWTAKSCSKFLGKSGAYVIWNHEKLMGYVGVAEDLGSRWRSGHYCRLVRGRHFNPKLQAAWDEFGEDSFRAYVLEYCDDLNSLVNMEPGWVDKLDCYKNGYNMTSTGSSKLVWTSEDRAKSNKRKKQKHKKILICLRDGQLDGLRLKAELTGLSVSDIVRIAVSNFLLGNNVSIPGILMVPEYKPQI